MTRPLLATVALVGALGLPAQGAVGPGLPPFGLGDFDRSEPISITADQLEARDDKARRTLAFRRNVVVRQGPLRLSASVLSAVYVDGEDQPRRLEARGNVRIQEGTRRARCNDTVYDRLARTIVCRGEPAELWDGEDHLTGSRITFDLERRSVQVEGGSRIEIHRDLSGGDLADFGEGESEELSRRLREGGPITIDAGALEASDPGDERRIRFDGGVVLRQNDVELRAAELVALYPAGGRRPDRLLAEGDVVLREGAREGRCARAEYRLPERVITCVGDAVLRDGSDRLEGDRIAFDLEARVVDAVGNTRLFVRPRPVGGDAR